MTVEPSIQAFGTERFFCLLGGDGSGKTTLLNALATRHPDLMTVHWKELSSVTLLPRLFPDLNPPETLRRLGPNSRAAQFCYLAALEYEMIVQPALAAGKTVIVDSYWYKFVAKMRVLDMAAPFLYPVCQSLPSPDRIIFLDTPLELARERKSEMNFFDCNGDAANFMTFQEALRRTMLDFVAGLPLTRLDGRASIDDLLDRVAEICVAAARHHPA